VCHSAYAIPGAETHPVRDKSRVLELQAPNNCEALKFLFIFIELY